MPPQLMYDTERVITFRNGFNQYPHRANIIELVEAQVFALHFSINRINVFDPAGNFRLNAMRRQFTLELINYKLDVLLTFQPFFIQ